MTDIFTGPNTAWLASLTHIPEADLTECVDCGADAKGFLRCAVCQSEAERMKKEEE